jgi:hypothetical protein
MRTRRILAAAAWLSAALSGTAPAQPEPVGAGHGEALETEAAPRESYAQAVELPSERWSGGGALGVMGATPDETAMALTTHADYFLDDETSIGPLAQFGVTDDMALVGVSGQAKRWFALDGTQGRSQIHVQGGLGFIHADIAQDDTSWLIPFGVGIDHTLDSGVTLTATTLVNFTNLDVAGDDAHVMPSLMFGLRF